MFAEYNELFTYCKHLSTFSLVCAIAPTVNDSGILVQCPDTWQATNFTFGI